MPNTQLGPYEILSPLGAGGMGEVYRARDTRLDRDVAIKVLPDTMARDQERVLRFDREAKVLATLNHQNIAAVYGFEQVEDKRLLVMELAEGETLAERLKRGSMLVPDALELAIGIARALESAHEKGIVHRDLKPANIKITPDGTVKVLDFGLAKAVSGELGGSSIANSPTITLEHTRPGVVLGTAAYMSPEQARGKPVDKRTDIWSFGCVLFECLSGQRPFQGDTATDLIAKILERDPAWSMLPEQTPPTIQLLLRRCMAKDRGRRLRDIGDARVEIESALEGETASGFILAGTALAPRRRGRRAYLAVGAAMLLTAALSALGGWLLSRPPNPASRSPVYRFSVDLPAGYKLHEAGPYDFNSLCISDDGSAIAFAAEREGTSHIFVRELAAQEARLLPGTEGGGNPLFSPDGRWLAFNAGRKLKKVPVAGGPAITLADALGSTEVWLADGTLVFTTAQGRTVTRYDERTATARVIAEAGLEKRTSGGEQPLLGFQTASAVPGADYIIAGIWDGDTIEDYATVAVWLSDGTVRPVLQNAINAKYVEPGYLVFLRGASVLAVRFDVAEAATIGDPTLLIDGVASSKWADEGHFATSLNGTLAYVFGGRRGPGRRLIHVDAEGKAAPLMDGTEAIVGGIGLSPNGDKLTLVTLRRNVDLWTFDLARRSLSLINNIGESWNPVWMPNQEYILFQQVVPEKFRGLVRKSVDGIGPAEPYPLDVPGDVNADSFSPDGKFLLYGVEDTSPDRLSDIGLYRTDQQVPPEIIVGGRAYESDARFAPDGKHFAFVSTETSRPEVFVWTIDRGTGKRQISPTGGYSPRWSRDGTKLYFLDLQDGMHEVEIDLGENPRFSTPKKLFDAGTVATTDLWGAYDVAPDGGFIMVAPAEWETKPTQIELFVNWTGRLPWR